MKSNSRPRWLYGGELRLGCGPSSAEELHVLGDDLTAAAGATFLILIRPVLQAAFNIERIALLDVCSHGLRETIPADDGVELRCFLALDLAIRDQADGRHSFAGLGMPQFGIARGVADEDDVVDAAHEIERSRSL